MGLVGDRASVEWLSVGIWVLSEPHVEVVAEICLLLVVKGDWVLELSGVGPCVVGGHHMLALREGVDSVLALPTVSDVAIALSHVNNWLDAVWLDPLEASVVLTVVIWDQGVLFSRGRSGSLGVSSFLLRFCSVFLGRLDS